MIIGLNGYSGSGKDAVGTIIQYLTSKYKPCTIEECLKYEQDFSKFTDWKIKKWAGKLKEIASMLTGIPVEKFEDQEFKKTEMGPQWNCQFYTEGSGWQRRPMLVRDFLQKLGTDAVRDGLHTNAWVNALMSDYTAISDKSYVLEDGTLFDLRTLPGHPVYPSWIITDTRFPNEAEAIKSAGGLVIRIDRPGVKPINNHPSEISLDDWDFDYKIANASDITALTETVRMILTKEEII